ncbi:GTPase HflX [uncultured Litoreibacter sp.]|uniref:GTPase HflX n=1 Tax=uncultured Litoreibacter sp. TaxID=1392394 RepID=UPI00261977E0|nr:GTPase HflX [uncultured Litoreibacter sp.]
MLETEERSTTRAWVLHPDIKDRSSPDHSRRDAPEALAEAVALAVALPGLDVVGDEVVPLPKTRAGTLFGSGKIEELKHRFHDNEVELVLIDGPVTPVQQRNLEKEWKVKILDRTGLILEIFSDRAATREGVLQVELAALSYQRTRLVRAWTHLERQRGGLGFVGGPGETQIEADRRAIDERINKIKNQLDKTVKTRELHRAARAKVPFPIVALVGYTNAGKSTLFNRLTGADVMVKDMLFATLDPTMRSVELPDGVEIIMSDTVGFISDLPTQLVAAFRATLEEVLSADLILHVRDISHAETDNQATDVRAILADLGVDQEIKTLEVWNKLDKLDGNDHESLSNIAARDDSIFLTSAVTGAGMGPLLEAISREVTEATTTEDMLLPFSEGKKRAWLFDQEVVDQEDATEDGFALSVTWSAKQKARFDKL